MKRVQVNQIALVCLGIVFVFFIQGCAVFGPVGHAISQGYENTVTYFNGYYNAKGLFNEAEDEVRADILAKRGQDLSQSGANQIPGSTKDKLNKVIDRCSNILAFHSSSALVDNALFLIGKSFFYEAEYLKAERKFTELLAQYPNSSFVLEAHIWYARTEEKLNKVNEGIRICESAISLAKEDHDEDLEAQAHQVLGSLYLIQKRWDNAIIENEKILAFSVNKDLKAETVMKLGDIHFSQEEYEKAAHMYLQIGEYTSDIYMNYYGGLHASQSYLKLREYPRGLKLIDEMIDNFRYKIYLPELLYERANNYAASGRRNDAIEEYIYIDTTYTPKEYSIRSAYQLGQIYEKEIGDYRLALKYYTKVNASSGLKSVEEGKMKYVTLTRYFQSRRNLYLADSLLTVLMNAKMKMSIDSLTGAADSLELSFDTLQIQAGIARLRANMDSTNGNIPSLVNQYSHDSADSLLMVKAIRDSLQYKINSLIERTKILREDTLTLTSDSLRPDIQESETLSHPFRKNTRGTDIPAMDSVRTKSHTTSRRYHAKQDLLRAGKSFPDSIQVRDTLHISRALSGKSDSISMKMDSSQQWKGKIALRDSLSKSDSIKTIKKQALPVSISVDSINVLKSIAAQELGDIFYSELLVPDSAYYWYNNALTWSYDSDRSPRILYILAELSGENTKDGYRAPEEFYKQLNRDFSRSNYAEEARRFLGITTTNKKLDTAAVYYQQAEKQVDAKQYTAAIKTFYSISKDFPQSKLAAKSDYAIGWIYENHLALPDSAFVQYKRVTEKYKGTRYAEAAGNQIAGALEQEKAIQDSLNKIEEDSIKTATAKLDSMKAATALKDSLKMHPAKIDTLKIKDLKRDTVKSNYSKVDTGAVNRLKPAPLRGKNDQSDSIKFKDQIRDTSQLVPGFPVPKSQDLNKVRTDTIAAKKQRDKQ